MLGETIPPIYAYNLEAEGGEVLNTQREGGVFQRRSEAFSTKRVVRELGIEWMVIDYRSGDRATVPARDCTREIDQLQEGDIIMIIQGKEERKDIAFGRSERVTAAMIKQGSEMPFFCVHGFDFPAYKEKFIGAYAK